MITIKFLGGAKKSFARDNLTIEKDSMSVSALLSYLQKILPENLTSFDVKNILVAVNGVDSSALQGQNTNLKDGDIITIIPLVHGGENRKRFVIINTNIELIKLKKTKDDPVRFLETLREKYPTLVIQGIQSNYVLNLEHVKKIIALSLAAKKAGELLSNKMETDILMRFACTRQISDAITRVGLQKGTDYTLIVVGKRSSIDKLFREIKHMLLTRWTFENNAKFVQQKFSITKKELDCVISTTPLEDVLAERSAVLFH
jgi:tRNA threonylcarbamoyladenosine modification (KEOPS) complex Cgi121 subunit/molybdopterin converting factor small subunit